MEFVCVCVCLCGLWGHKFVQWYDGYYEEKVIYEDNFSVPIIQEAYKS